MTAPDPEKEKPTRWIRISTSATAGLLLGALSQWLLPQPAPGVVASLLCLVVAVVNLKPPYDIPNECTAFGLCLGLARPPALLLSALPGMLLAWALFAFIQSTGNMGAGCTKWAAVLGLWLGLPLALLNSMLAFALGALVAIPLVFLKRDSQTPIPFGVFLSLAGLVCIWAGPSVLNLLDLGL